MNEQDDYRAAVAAIRWRFRGGSIDRATAEAALAALEYHPGNTGPLWQPAQLDDASDTLANNAR